jgi:nucleoredoxin
MASLLGDVDLVLADGSTVPASSLEGKVIAFYFSASWCGPCQHFTPDLITYYQSFKGSHAEKDNFEIVLVSSDRSQGDYDKYRAKMPWPAVPFGDELKSQLNLRFGINGIPSLVFVDADGTTLSKSGRVAVAKDPQAAQWPYRPRPLTELIGDSFINAEGDEVPRSALEGKYLALYFSAHWCPPCRAFTPQLAETYKKIVAAGKPFELIFVSSDREEHEFAEYLQEMPWVAIPMQEQERIHALKSHFGVQGIPSLVVLSPDLKLVNGNARVALAQDKEGADFPWAPKPIMQLNEMTVSEINADPFLVQFVDGQEQVDAALAMLTPLAEAEAANADADNRTALRVFVAEIDSEVSSFVRSFLSLPDTAPQTVLVNVPRQGKHVPAAQEMTEENLRTLFAAYKEGTVNYTGLKA